MRSLTRYILSTFGGRAVRRASIEEACRRFGVNPIHTINFMISYGYLIRVLRGLYYVKTLEEFKLKKVVNIYKAVSLGMDELKVRWYFGLYTALRLNGVTHEFSDIIFVLNEEIFRPKEVNIGGEEVRFIKLKPGLFGFGTVNRDRIKFSDVEKTILDFIYLSRYRSIPEERIASMMEEYAEKARPERVRAYLRFYPKSVERVVKNGGLI